MESWIRIGIAITAIVVTAFFIANALFIFLEEDSIKISSSNPIQYPILSDSDLYDYYSSLERPQTLNYMVYVVDPIDDSFMKSYSYGKSLYEIISLVRQIPYNPDDGGTEYPQYPIETITNWKGDCEDKSILCASMLYSQGYEVCLYRFDSHMAVGILLNNSYVYVDPTIDTPNGEIPTKYKNQNMIQYTENSPILTHKWSSANVTVSVFKKMMRLNVEIENEALHNEDTIFSVHIYNDTYSIYENYTLTIEKQSSLSISMSLNVEWWFYGNVTTSLIVDSKIVDTRGGTI